MKITSADYDELLAQVKLVVDKAGLERIKRYRSELADNPKVKDVDMRFRWDLLWACGQEFTGPWTRNVYTYASDAHIDTVLKTIVKELGL